VVVNCASSKEDVDRVVAEMASKGGRATAVKGYSRGWLGPYIRSRVLPGEFHSITAYLFVEYKCNLDCWYCWSYNNRVKGMTEDVARRSIDWLHDDGCRVLALMGGEPLLRPEFIHKVVCYAAKKGFWVYIATNGRLLRPDFADRLGDAGVTFASFGDNAFVYVQNNGVNSVSVDLPNYTLGNLQINHNPRNGLPYFDTALFTPNALGTQGNAKRRFFYGPGINNFDVALHKMTKLTETKSLEFRFETFNTFNHAQFYPNDSVNGNINSPTFGHVLKAAPPRIGQVSLRFNF